MKGFHCFLLITAFIFCTPVFSLAAAHRIRAVTQCPHSVIDTTLNLIEEHRIELGLSALRKNARLERAARIHSLHMIKIHSMTHAGWFSEAIASGYKPVFIGQNIAAFFKDPYLLFSAWIASSGHRTNIENPKAADTGISCMRDLSGRYWWTQYFGAAR